MFEKFIEFLEGVAKHLENTGNFWYSIEDFFPTQQDVIVLCFVSMILCPECIKLYKWLEKKEESKTKKEVDHMEKFFLFLVKKFGTIPDDMHHQEYKEKIEKIFSEKK
ncbi:MAG: hypothetical protein WCI36_03820 [bacterium]